MFLFYLQNMCPIITHQRTGVPVKTIFPLWLFSCFIFLPHYLRWNDLTPVNRPNEPVAGCGAAAARSPMRARVSRAGGYLLHLLLVCCSPVTRPSDKMCTFDLQPAQNGQQYLVGNYCETTRLAWFTGLLWRSDLSPPYLPTTYFMAFCLMVLRR